MAVESPDVERITVNLERVRARVEGAARRVGRAGDSIELVAVTKSWPAELVRHAYQAGLRRVGENRVAEADAKRAQLADLMDLAWDMVGHIQSRKAETAAAVFDRVHSVDRWKIARLLAEKLPDDAPRLPIFLECNVSGEASKYGYDMNDPDNWQVFLPEFERVAGLARLEICGLMTMAPWNADQAIVRATFSQLRHLRDWLAGRMPAVDWRHLSMGMTDDFELAIEEGATVIRVGRALFGERPV